jgi:hypothetical protein
MYDRDLNDIIKLYQDIAYTLDHSSEYHRDIWRAFDVSIQEFKGHLERVKYLLIQNQETLSNQDREYLQEYQNLDQDLKKLMPLMILSLYGVI